MKITRIDCHVLLVPEFHTEACSSAQDNLVVEIHTDEGIVGIGETDVNPWIARACIKAMGTHIMGLGLGGDAARRRSAAAGGDLAEALQRLEDEWAARGADLRNGRDRHGALGYQGQGAGFARFTSCLGGAVKESITPYASLLPTGDTLAEYRRIAEGRSCCGRANTVSRRPSWRSASMDPIRITRCGSMTIISPASSPSVARRSALK